MSDWISEAAQAKPPSHKTVIEVIDGIPKGEHDIHLHKLASWLRGQVGLSPEAIEEYLKRGPSAVLEDVDPENPYTDKDFHRIAKSVGKYEAAKAPSPKSKVVWGDPSMYVGPPKSWWIHGFIPKGELVTFNGKGAAGKSTFASFIAASVSSKGGKILRIGSEEPFERYLVRAAFAGGTPYAIANYTEPSSIKLPEGADVLRTLIEEHGFEFVYFDSIVSHFPSDDGRNAAERTRACLAPLADIAIQTGCTILCTFHENKAGSYMGSTEMENVGRVRLSIIKVDGKSIVSVEKTNFKEPNYRMMLRGEWETIVNPETGQVQMEEDEDGGLVPDKVFVVEGFDKIGREELEAGRPAPVRTEVANSRAREIVEFMGENPHLTQKEVGAHFGVSQMLVSRAKLRIR